MIKNFDFERFYDFVERNTEDYSFSDGCGSIEEDVVRYAEYAVRKKHDGEDEEAGLYMAAALNLALMLSFTRCGQYYLNEAKPEELNEEALIDHYALKLVEAEYTDKPYEEQKKIRKSLVDTVTNYIITKDAEEEYDEDYEE